MAKLGGRAVALVLVLLCSLTMPMLSSVSAHSSILLTTNSAHLILTPGESSNISIQVENNGSSIETYNVTVDDSTLDSVWTVSATQSQVVDVFPTWSKNTTITIMLAEGAMVSDSGQFSVTLTETDSGVSSTISIFLSVAPHYQPSLQADAGTRVEIGAGDSATATYTVSNYGSVTDTFLLDVEVEPDLSGWWANQTQNTSTNQGNLSLLMYGNSYTSTNALDTLIDDHLVAGGYTGQVQANTGGGMRLDQHWASMSSSSHQWNTSLKNSDWDYVVLQDQSQVPSFPTNDSMWNSSMQGAVNMSALIDAEGAEVVLFMTWGYRDGDALNPFNNNFSSMQANLLEGYTRYAENISNAGHSVWIAPVGLAFKTVYDSVVAAGSTPNQTGNLFYDLYAADGSHPSIEGSYLASCVIFSSTTGDTCVGQNDAVSLDAATKLALQQAADDTVFNQTAGQSYYPWEGGSSTFGLGGNIPAGWLIAWEDDEFVDLEAGATDTATLSIEVPSDAQPDYYGFRLTIGSTKGNVTTSTLLVVEVASEAHVQFAFLNQTDEFFSGRTTMTQVRTTNSGNVDLNLTWEVRMNAGPCDASLPTMQPQSVPSGQAYDLSLQVDVDETATSASTCDVSIKARSGMGDSTYESTWFNFTIDIDLLVDFNLTGPTQLLEFMPGIGIDYEVRVHNLGSDTAWYYLDVLAVPGLDTFLVSASGVEVEAGEIGSWQLTTDADVGMVGLTIQGFEATQNGQTQRLDVEFLLEEAPGIELNGPFDFRHSVTPGLNSTMNLTLRNSGTSNLTLIPSIMGLPSGVVAVISESSLMLQVSEIVNLSVTFEASTQALTGSYDVVLAYGNADVSAVYAFTLFIEHRISVQLDNQIMYVNAHPLIQTNVSMVVTNTGTASHTYSFSYSSAGGATWFDVTTSPSTFTLGAGDSTIVIVSVKERAFGASEDGIEYTFTARSTTQPDVYSTQTMSISPVMAKANLQIVTNVDSAKPGEAFYGTVIITNVGNGLDTFTLSTVGRDCGLDTSVTLDVGQSSAALGWSCIVANDAPAGTQSLVFRAMSSVRSSSVIDQATNYTVEPYWPGQALVGVSLEDVKVRFGSDSSGSTIVTVTNLGNTLTTGNLELIGSNTGIFTTQWIRLSDQTSTTSYSLSSGSSEDFKLTFISAIADADETTFKVRATSVGSGRLTSDDSVEMMVTIIGPSLPPNGLSLPMGYMLDQTTGWSLMVVGWLMTLLLARAMLKRPRSNEKDMMADEEVHEEDEDEEKESPSDLGFNECRIGDGNKVTCPSCEAALGVPRGSVAPFRFTCPTCSGLIRVVE